MKITIANLILKLLGIRAVVVPEFDPEHVASALDLCSQMDKKNAAGEYKRTKVIAGLMNRHQMRHSDASLLVELVLCGAVR